MNPAWGWCLSAAWAVVSSNPAALERFEATEVHMGTTVTIVVYADSNDTANAALRAAFDRVRKVDAVMSDYRGDSELNQLCRQSPTQAPVRISDSLWEVLDAAQRLSRTTDGAFDVTVGPLTRLWRRARRQKQFPSADRLEDARKSVSYHLLKLHPDPRSVELLAPSMQLDLGGIAKGYAADQALDELQSRGLTRALVNAGGDLAIGDPPPQQQGWKIGLAPLGPEEPPSRLLSLARCGLATSGDAWQFVELDGRRYSHILDPRTGVGLTDHCGVSLVAPNGMTADALASAVSVLGPDSGLKLVEKTPGAAALVVRVEQGQVRTYESARFGELPVADR